MKRSLLLTIIVLFTFSTALAFEQSVQVSTEPTQVVFEFLPTSV